MVGQRKRKYRKITVEGNHCYCTESFFSIEHKHGQIISLAFSQSEYIGSTTSQTSETA